jgi:hypothetical protein
MATRVDRQGRSALLSCVAPVPANGKSPARKRLFCSLAAVLTLTLVLMIQVPASAAVGWVGQPSPDWNLFGVSAGSTNAVWAVGQSGISKTTDGGSNNPFF